MRKKLRVSSAQSQQRRLPTSTYYHKRIRNRGGFRAAFCREMKRNDDTPASLARALMGRYDRLVGHLLKNWANGKTAPREDASFALLNRIEQRYDLTRNFFKQIILPDTPTQNAIDSVNVNEQHLMRWHLPQEFDELSPARRREILAWIAHNVLRGATDFGKYLRETSKSRYGLRFPPIEGVGSNRKIVARYQPNAGRDNDVSKESVVAGEPLIDAPPRLVAEVTDLVRFKRSTLAPPGVQREAGWGAYTAQIRVRTYGIFMGALTASSKSSVNGFGVPPKKLSLGLLIFPKIWDWYLGWREKRRGFFTSHERNSLIDLIALTQRSYGWLRQHPEIITHVRPIEGLISGRDILLAKRNWNGACDTAIAYARSRLRELRRITQRHRDPFLAIMPVLQSGSPLTEYRKITTEIFRSLPDQAKFPLRHAETMRSYLMFRLGMHLGLRQRNLRELLFCPRGRNPKSDDALTKMRCGELRWSKYDNCWEVYLPYRAFKNSESAFFKKQPYRTLLPSLDGLTRCINEYTKRYRFVLLGNAPDPGTFFVRTMKPSSKKTAAYSDNGFYNAWRNVISIYGIFNPYTLRGAIEGLLPHGPHSVRDVIATHVVKQTASYELAAFAIHDTPQSVMHHYCRFLPEEKSKLAAVVLNKVWI